MGRKASHRKVVFLSFVLLALPLRSGFPSAAVVRGDGMPFPPIPKLRLAEFEKRGRMRIGELYDERRKKI